MTSEPYVLIVSTVADVATDAVVKRLAARGVPFRRLNSESFPFQSTLAYQLGGARDSAWLAIGSDEMPEPASVWYRRVRVPERPEDMDSGIYDFCMRESRAALLGGVLRADARWMSHPAMTWQAEYKPLQLSIAQRVGLKIPRTLVSNDPDKIVSAFRSLSGLIAKPARSGHLVHDGCEMAIFTSQVLEEHLAHIEQARWSPAIYQELIPKRFDVRVTIVGSTVFAAYIDSQSDPAAMIDWRHTQDPHLPHHRAELPISLMACLLQLMSRLNLTFGAIDLILTPSGEYVFLEVNPVGQWLWLDDQLQLGITDAVSEWLVPGAGA